MESAEMTRNRSQAVEQRYREKNRAAIALRERNRMRSVRAADPDFSRKRYAHEMARDPEGILKRSRRSRGMPEPTRPEPAVCEICGASPSKRWTRLCVDHDHSTGAFRGWICHQCNYGMGLLGDSLPSINLVVRYLENAEKEAQALAAK